MNTQIFGFNERISLINKYTTNKIDVMLRIEKTKVLAAKIIGDVCNCKKYSENIINSSWSENANTITSLMPAYPYHLKLLLTQSWEKLTKKTFTIPDQAKYLRILLLEIERIQNHLDFIISIAHSVDYSLLSLKTLQLKEKISNILKREESSLDICFGGVTEELPIDEQATIERNLQSFLRDFGKIKRKILRNIILKNQLKDVGIIARDEAKKLSLSGPIARSSGITIDIRKSDPYTSYNDFEFSIAVSDNCDLLGETLVRCQEIEESVSIINQLLEKLPSDAYKADVKGIEIPSSSLIERIESPNGELFLFIVSQQGTLGSKPKRGNLVLPSKVNKQGFLARITSEYFDNIPTIIPSLGNGWI